VTISRVAGRRKTGERSMRIIVSAIDRKDRSSCIISYSRIIRVQTGHLGIVHVVDIWELGQGARG